MSISFLKTRNIACHWFDSHHAISVMLIIHINRRQWNELIEEILYIYMYNVRRHPSVPEINCVSEFLDLLFYILCFCFWRHYSGRMIASAWFDTFLNNCFLILRWSIYYCYSFVIICFYIFFFRFFGTFLLFAPTNLLFLALLSDKPTRKSFMRHDETMISLPPPPPGMHLFFGDLLGAGGRICDDFLGGRIFCWGNFLLYWGIIPTPTAEQPVARVASAVDGRQRGRAPG